MKKIDVVESYNLSNKEAVAIFATDMQWIIEQGGSVNRYKEEEATVLKTALPITLLDGAIVLSGYYPTRDQLTAWLEIKSDSTEESSAPCCGSCGG